MTDLIRVAAGASVGAAGVVLLGIVGTRLVTGSLPLPGFLLAGFGLLIGAALLAGGYLLSGSEFTTRQTLRVAGWNALGIVVLGAAMALLFAYQSAVASPPPAPLFSGAVVVGVSAVAHVLIGYNDVRRIRADELARERQKLRVLNRLVRHNLRTAAQVLYGYADRLVDMGGPGSGDVAAGVRSTGEDLAAMHDDIRLIQRVVDRSVETTAVDLATVVDGAVTAVREAHPRAVIEVDVPEGLTVAGGEHLADAVEEVVSNAVEHADSESPHVELSARRVDGRVELSVVDDGPGIPESERAVVTGDRQVTQLEHSSGLGLWVVRWILEAHGGELAIGEAPGGGAEVRLRFSPAG